MQLSGKKEKISGFLRLVPTEIIKRHFKDSIIDISYNQYVYKVSGEIEINGKVHKVKGMAHGEINPMKFWG